MGITLFLIWTRGQRIYRKILCQHEEGIRIPTNDERVRSLNVSNTVCMMIVYEEALRQQGLGGWELSHRYETTSK